MNLLPIGANHRVDTRVHSVFYIKTTGESFSGGKLQASFIIGFEYS